MDPEKLWEDIVGMADDCVTYQESSMKGEYCPGEMADMDYELAQKVQQLRDWLSNGGFMPQSFIENHKR